MNTHLSRALTFLHGSLSFLLKASKELFIVAVSHKYISLSIIVALIAAGAGVSFIFEAKTDSPTDQRREVTLLSTNDLLAPEPIALIGQVRSVREANITADAPGTVARVYKSLGDFVGAGTIIAELKNDSQRAGVAQAEAALDKAKTGATITGIGLDSAEDSLVSAIASGKNTILSTYSIIDDAVNKKVDSVFSNATGPQPKFSVLSSNSQFVRDAENKRLQIQSVLIRENKAPLPNDAQGTLQELENLSRDIIQVRDLLTTVISTLNKGIASGSVTDAAIAGYRTEVSIALGNVNASASQVNGAIDNLKSRIAAVKVSTENVPSGSALSADVRAAQANLQAAQANLEKTLIRSPIAGTINRLDLEIGSFVNAAVPLVYIANAQGLEIVVFVSERDIADISVGANVLVGKSIKGRVSKLATALDPVTKKAELRISIPQDAPLISGSSISVSIARNVERTENTTSLTIPLSALKITPEGTIVFTVENEKTVSHQIITGALSGSRIEVISGITTDMLIIEDARGLKDDEGVIVSN
ncbi:efflux RND transporter periplasmic adaptor subunit [Patescibacteria group bacterium]|nr:MAG: efflux RND transporter periplasmic adaptor subunit [Patescibacteria group bacterium]